MPVRWAKALLLCIAVCVGLGAGRWQARPARGDAAALAPVPALGAAPGAATTATAPAGRRGLRWATVTPPAAATATGPRATPGDATAPAAAPANAPAAVGGGPDAPRPDPGMAPSDRTLAWPVTGQVSSPFGPRWGRFHAGIDIAAPHGTEIRAAAPGDVVLAEWVDGYGNTVVLDHGDGTRTLYAHASRLEVQPGQSVAGGDIIARVGSTGNSTGPHLHFEYIAGGAVDPTPYLPKRSTP